MNLSHQAPRGVWILYPVLGGLFCDGTKKHYYTPIAKYYKFNQCGNGGSGKGTFLEHSDKMNGFLPPPRQLQISQRLLDTGRGHEIPLVQRISLSVAQRSVIQIDGHWGPWSFWSSCSLSCGHGGKHKRSRHCNNPAPVGNGRVCVGEQYQSKSCAVTDLCPDAGRHFFEMFLYILNFKVLMFGLFDDVNLK